MSSRIHVLIVALLVSLGGVAAADEPLPLPLPRTAPGQSAQIVAPVIVYRPSAYDVWQYRAVDRQGQWRPRMIYTPYGTYNSFTGQPYHWNTAEPRNFMPYAVD
jgi:hypothetical protein